MLGYNEGMGWGGLEQGSTGKILSVDVHTARQTDAVKHGTNVKLY